MKKLILFQVFDYRQTYFSQEKGELETYIYQNQFMSFTAGLIDKHEIQQICVVCLGAAEEYDQILANRVRAVGIPFGLKNRKQSQRKIKALIDVYSPTHAIIQVPLPKLIEYCQRLKIRAMVMIADSFTGMGVRGIILCKLFAWLLNNKYVELVSNHNYPASYVLKNFGVKTEKIVPWDFPWDIDFNKYPVKILAKNQQVWKFFYAGRILEEKGVGDIITAIHLLRKKDIELNVVFAGGGKIAEFKKQAADLGIAERINFLGTITHEQVLSAMREADIVLVPSQIKSGEGMACTIYESFLVKTPLILSDHPMFKAKVENGVFFKAGNPDSLAKIGRAHV
jgi:glycosyltransferase involved in cell wall biosynthesis